MGSYRLLLYCESTFEERSAGNPHATFCESRRRVTASGDSVRQYGWLLFQLVMLSSTLMLFWRIFGVVENKERMYWLCGQIWLTILPLEDR